MTLITPNSGPEGLIDVGIHLSGNWSVQDPVFMAKYPNYSFRELGISNLIRDAFIPFYGMDVRRYFFGALETSQRAREATWHGDKPVLRPFNHIADLNNYGSSWDTLLVRPLQDGKFAAQHGVNHLTGHGRFVPKHAMVYVEEQQNPYSHNKEWKYFRKYIAGTSNYSSTKVATSFANWSDIPFSTQNPGRSIGMELQRLLDSAENIQDTYSPVPYVSYVSPLPVNDLPIRGNYRASFDWYEGDHVFNVGQNSIEVGNALWHPGYPSRYMHYTWSIDLFDRSSPGGPFAAGALQFSAVMRISGVSYLMQYNPLFTGPDGIKGWRVLDAIPFDRTVTIVPNVFPLSLPYGRGIDASLRSPVIVNTIRERHKRIRQGAADIRPSSMFSFQDALLKMSATDTNFLEAAAEGQELIKLLPALVGIIKAFFTRKPGRLASTFGKAFDASAKIGDLLSDTLLLTQFGLKPALENTAEVRHMVSTVGPKLKALQSGGTFHGKFVKNFQHELGPMKLVTRTTARMQGISDDFVIKFLALDALGLSPKASNIWDIVPWSWFVDYFFHIGTSLSLVDTYIMGNVRGTQWAVHSYTLYDSADADIAFHGLQPGQATIKHYFREVSRITPGLFGGRYDFAQHGGPDVGITSSVFWQMLR